MSDSVHLLWNLAKKVKVGCEERQRTRDSWGAKHIRQGLAQKAWNLVQSMSRSTFQHLSIMKPFNGAFSHSIHLIVQSLSHSVIQSSTHCHSVTFPICRLVLVNASYIRTEGLCCIALFMDGNGPNLLTVGLTCAFGFHQNPIHHPQPPSMGPQNEQTHHSTRLPWPDHSHRGKTWRCLSKGLLRRRLAPLSMVQNSWS